MQHIQSQFLSNITSIREIDTLYQYLKNDLHLANDFSDLLRSEIVYAVSALDKLVHELVRFGMIETFKGLRTPTSAYKGFTLSVETLENIRRTTIERNSNLTVPPTNESDLPEYWFEKQIVLTNKKSTFQGHDKIAQGLSLIWIEAHKWQKIVTQMGLAISEESVVKTFLTNIVDRRNKIVHETDIDIAANIKLLIEYQEAKDIIDFIEKVGRAIFACVTDASCYTPTT
jgi:RiboL-PSP-HEPN